MPPREKNKFTADLSGTGDRLPLTPGGKEHHAHLRVLIPVIILLTALLLLLGEINLLTIPPAAFRPDTLVEIPLGYSLDAIAVRLHEDSVIRSPLLFKLLVQHYGKEKGVPAGIYLFKSDRKSTRLNSSHIQKSRMPSSA